MFGAFTHLVTQLAGNNLNMYEINGQIRLCLTVPHPEIKCSGLFDTIDKCLCCFEVYCDKPPPPVGLHDPEPTFGRCAEDDQVTNYS